jgi:3-hydroxybutyryl-CoA dehydrogenase
MEALRLLGERIAEIEQIDRIYRMGAGFRMGPFELMDLVGIDVGYAVAQSFTTLSFGEPRWKPSPLQAQMVASGRLGRKTGRGWYAYADDGSWRIDDPEPPAPDASSSGTIAIVGSGLVADVLRDRAAAAGIGLVQRSADAQRAVILIEPGDKPVSFRPGTLVLVSCTTRSLASWAMPGAIGFSLIPLAINRGLVELTRGRAACHDGFADRAGQLMADLGLHSEWVADAPGLVLGRVIAQLVNEACFAVGEQVATSDDVDTGVRLGLNSVRLYRDRPRARLELRGRAGRRRLE